MTAPNHVTINDKHLKCEIETKSVTFAAKRVFYPINDKHLKCEIETE